MKKTLLTLFAIAALATTSFAAKHKFDSFINGYQPGTIPGGFGGTSVALQITNSGTSTATLITNGQTNVTYYIQGVPYGYTYGTNYTLVTNGQINPAAWFAAGGTNIFWSSNTALTQVTNATSTNTSPPALIDIPITADINNDPAQLSLLIAYTPDNASVSNTYTFTFGRTLDGVYYGTNTGETVAIASTLAGAAGGGLATNTTVINTNLPTWFTQGARAIRCLSVKLATNGLGVGTNTYINQMGIGQYVP